MGMASWWWMGGRGGGERIVALGIYFNAAAAAEGRGESLAGMRRVGVKERQPWVAPNNATGFLVHFEDESSKMKKKTNP